MVKNRKKLAPEIDQLALRRWCIEQATRWPTHGYPGQNLYGGGGNLVKADLLADAEKILRWVLAS